MLTHHPAAERGTTKIGWLDSKHSFSFGGYYDPSRMGFSDLRVINEDVVAPGAGFGTHPHRDMEILSIVLEGALAHRDSLGSHGVLRPGEVQVMSAGTGVEHSEFNASESDPVHFLQIWIETAQRGATPRYDQKAFDTSARRGALQLVASPDGADGSLIIGQDARLYRATLDEGSSVQHAIAPRRRAWVHVVHGRVTIDGQSFETGDGIAVEGIDMVTIDGAADGSQVLVFDLR